MIPANCDVFRYEDNLRDLMHQFSATPWKSSLTELEVFIGTIMGESHRLTKRQKEISKSMREGKYKFS